MCNQLVLRVYLLVIHVNRLVSIIYTCIFAILVFRRIPNSQDFATFRKQGKQREEKGYKRTWDDNISNARGKRKGDVWKTTLFFFVTRDICYPIFGGWSRVFLVKSSWRIRFSMLQYLWDILVWLQNRRKNFCEYERQTRSFPLSPVSDVPLPNADGHMSQRHESINSLINCNRAFVWFLSESINSRHSEQRRRL